MSKIFIKKIVFSRKKRVKKGQGHREKWKEGGNREGEKEGREKR